VVKALYLQSYHSNVTGIFEKADKEFKNIGLRSRASAYCNLETLIVFFYLFLGDGNFSFDEFVEIVSNMGATHEASADEEEKELRDAFRVRSLV